MTVLIVITPIVSAKARNKYLTDFIFTQQDDNSGFGESEQETAYAFEIINYYNLYVVQGLFGSTTKVDVSAFKENLEEKLEETNLLYEIYFLLKALDILDYSLDSDLYTKIQNSLDQTEQLEGGFSYVNTSTSADMISTYYAYHIYSYIGEQFPNATTHKNWILQCNNTDGGYGGNSSLSSTILTTYYAVDLISNIGTIDDLDDKSATLNYLKSFYVSDSSNINNYGGYLPDDNAENSLLSSTYFCIKSINLIDSSQKQDATINWVLQHQNFQDGGFSDHSVSGEPELSSISSSYYAFDILVTFNAINLLNSDVFMVEFNYIILIVVLSCIGGFILLVFFIWRRRRI
ncbi:MAG: prenyltransferase/squalene oxidase repeat-containing protein [Candidatus Thorarchaeota archaeon]